MPSIYRHPLTKDGKQWVPEPLCKVFRSFSADWASPYAWFQDKKKWNDARQRFFSQAQYELSKKKKGEVRDPEKLAAADDKARATAQQAQEDAQEEANLQLDGDSQVVSYFTFNTYFRLT